MIKTKEAKLSAVVVGLLVAMGVGGGYLAHAESVEGQNEIKNSAKAEVASAQKKVAELSLEDVEKDIRGKYPSTEINSIEISAIQGLYEVSMGNNIAYTDAEGRYFLFGHMYDMHTQTDLTASKVDTANSDSLEGVEEWPKEYLEQALVEKKGTGENKFAVFTDPNCGYCQSLEEEFEKLDDVTIYRFVVPMLGSNSESVSIWCSSDPVQTLKDKMLHRQNVGMKSCNNPIQANLELAQKMGVRGTPFLIKPDGVSKYGYAEINELREWVKS